MEPIPEKYQVRTNRAVLESSHTLQKYSVHLRQSIRRMNFEDASSMANLPTGGATPSEEQVAVIASQAETGKGSKLPKVDGRT